MRRREPERERSSVEVPARFVLDDWLVPSERPAWATAAEHERHQRQRAYVRWLRARRGHREGAAS